jgi:ribosomal protein S18 acetylase RimI-like enzyme
MTPCEYLEWDSRFFGLRIARFRGRRLDVDALARAQAYCREERIDCLYFLADSGSPETHRLAQAAGFQFVDVRVTLERPLAGYAIRPAPAVREHRPSDRERLREIARVSHHDSRFYADPRFARPLCDGLYATWIDRSCDGWADCVLVAEAEGVPAGYLSCHLQSAAGSIGQSLAGSIGLVAVDGAYRGRGLGGQLVHAACAFFQARGMERATVVTQGRNIASQRLYQRCGFFTSEMQFWYHYWSRTEATR